MNDTPDHTEPVVSATALAKSYGGRTVVAGIDFEVRYGECVGVLGPNGAGKTTTLRMLLGMTPPSAGSLRVLGFKIPEQARRMRENIGVVPQTDNLDPDFTVAENLLVYARFFGIDRQTAKRRISRLLDFARLTDRAGEPVTNLSGGMCRRLTLARALVNEPQVLVLDEPTTGLDPQTRQIIWQYLRKLSGQGITLILTTHYMEEAARLCDRVIILDNGRILEQGSPTALIQQHIEPNVIEVHGNGIDAWHESEGRRHAERSECVGETMFYYTHNEEPLLEALSGHPSLCFLHRPANLEDVFLKLTGRDLRDE